jgi:hypothetical protein
MVSERERTVLIPMPTTGIKMLDPPLVPYIPQLPDSEGSQSASSIVGCGKRANPVLGATSF